MAHTLPFPQGQQQRRPPHPLWERRTGAALWVVISTPFTPYLRKVLHQAFLGVTRHSLRNPTAHCDPAEPPSIFCYTLPPRESNRSQFTLRAACDLRLASGASLRPGPGHKAAARTQGPELVPRPGLEASPRGRHGGAPWAPRRCLSPTSKFFRLISYPQCISDLIPAEMESMSQDTVPEETKWPSPLMTGGPRSKEAQANLLTAI